MTTANDNEAPRPLRFSDRAATAMTLLDLVVAESVDHPDEIHADVVNAVIFRDELDRLRAGLERLACELREAGL